ncbi:hypothetical protein [Mycolicibacterium bacteremicum]|uniref:hypothetical protein n=1 Tax=Mycolicibacterium bacteremicum TaxID=564198 RepID=UPI0026F12E03|nr:hypothetical protein [Mycolicibacterium bacteremicum]
MTQPFIGSEAVAAGRISKYQLGRRCTAIHPDIYVARGVELTLDDRASAAWLWSDRRGVLCGLTASALHGARYVEDSQPIELVWSNRRPPPGIRTHNHELADDEIAEAGRWGLPTTTITRTVFDLGRRGSLDEAVTRLDALGNARRFGVPEVLGWARSRHGGKRGLRQLGAALELHDAGSESPRETWLRLLIIRAGYPRPQTQIPVVSPDGRRRYFLDMGWEALKLAIEYDGDHHRSDPGQYAWDIVRSEDLAELGWNRIRATKRHTGADVLRRLSRVWPPTVHSDRDLRRNPGLVAPSAGS